MRKLHNLFLIAGLFAMSHAMAVEPCHGGQEIHIAYGNYCADNYTAAFQLAAIQEAIYDSQYSDPVYFHSLSYYTVGDQYCIFVQFVRCSTKKAPMEPPATKTVAVLNGALDKLEARGWYLDQFNPLENGFIEVTIANKEGAEYALVFDSEGDLAHMMPATK